MENAYRWMRESIALDTKCHKAKILHTRNDPKCRMCKEKD